MAAATLAVRGRPQRVPLTQPSFDGEEERRVVEVLRSGWVMQGPRVAAFEEAVAGYVGARAAVATSSGTTALQLSLCALGIGPGDAVLLPSWSFVATANAVASCGARPIFVEIDRWTYNLDPAALQQVLERACRWQGRHLRYRPTGERVKAVMPVDQVGWPCDMRAILALAARYRLAVIEDAACALGSVRQGQRVGALGSTLTCFSFHPRKVITTGEGGMVTTNHARDAQRLRQLRSHGILNGHCRALGYNYRMSDLHAAVGLAQLRKLDQLIHQRRMIAQRYHAGLSGVPWLSLPVVPPGVLPNYQSYLVRLSAQAAISRDDLVQHLRRRGIEARVGIAAMHTDSWHRQWRPRPRLPVTDAAARETFFLPLFPGLSPQRQERIVAEVRTCLRT